MMIWSASELTLKLDEAINFPPGWVGPGDPGGTFMQIQDLSSLQEITDNSRIDYRELYRESRRFTGEQIENEIDELVR